MKIYYFDANQSGMGHAPPNALANIDSSYSVTVDSSTDTISLNNAPEPSIQFITGQRYLFTQDDGTNATYKITFPEYDFATNTWLDSTRGVTPHGVPGRAYSYMLFQDDTNDANLRNYCLVDSQGTRKTTMTPPTITVTDICFNGFSNWYGGIETTVTFQNLYGTADVVLYDSNGDVVVPTSPSSLTLSYGTSTLAIVLGNDAPSGYIRIGGTYTEDVSYNYNAVSQKFVVTVEQHDSSPTFFIDNAYNTFLSMTSTNTYIFDLSFDTATYTFAFATDFDASGGTEYTANQSQVGSFLVLESAPSSQLYYYNPSTPNMGNQPKSWVTRTSGASMIGVSYNDYYGHAVACSSDGDTVIVGAYRGDYGGFNNREGAAYVYVWNTGTNSWDSKGSRIDGTNYEYLGYSVSMSSDGNLIAVGGYEYGDAVGRVQVFEWIDASGEWYKKGSDMTGSFAQNRMGKTVALSGSGTVVAMGTSDGKNDNGDRVGHVLVFEWVDVSGDWYQRGQTMNGDAKDDSFGMALAISHDGNTIAIGATGVDSADGKSTADGRGYVYGWEYSTSGEWGRMYQYSPPFWLGTFAYMGTSVSLSHDGNMFAIGGYNAQGIESNPHRYGLVQVFERNTPNAWTQVGSNIINTVVGQIGYSVKLSADGLTLVTGGNNGYFQVMTYTNGDWEMQENEIRLTTTGGHQISVDMSSDGTKVIAGNSKDGINDTGKAVPYIYE